MSRSVRAAALAVALVLTAAACTRGSNSAEQTPDRLVVSTFGFASDRFEQAVVAPFEQDTGIDVVVETGGNADRLSKVRISRNNPKVDVIMLSDLYATIGEQEGLFEKVDPEQVPNLAKVHDFAKNPDGFGPAYTFQLLGMVYRTDLVPEPPTLEQLWAPEYRGKIAVPDVSISAGIPFLYATGAAYGSGPQDVDTAFAKLAELSPNVLQFFSRSTEVVSLLDRGEIVMAPSLDLFAVDPVKAGKPIAWTPLDQGRYVVANTAQIVKGTSNKAGAEQFLNHLLSTEVQQEAAAAFNDKPVNREAEIPESLTNVAGDAAGDPEAAGFAPPDLKLAIEHRQEWVERFAREVSG